METQDNLKHPISSRFRGFLPVIIDVETGGFNAATDALLEIAAATVTIDNTGTLVVDEQIGYHVKPFEGANIEAAAVEFNGIDPFHPLRPAIDEKEALHNIFKVVRKAVKKHDCTRAILVGHNPTMDLAFLNAAVERTGIKRNPFHPFSSFDTATLGGLAYGQTVLARAVQAAGINWENDRAHSARYDAERTAQLFCNIVNRWDTETQGIHPFSEMKVL
ncbi:MAG: ribonuclease T [Gammaproteobacteria bacterium]|nr:MAG: ribonuclease T [Gammaproteobacteria bacterium]